MSNVAIRSPGNQAALCRIRGNMIAAATKGYSRPNPEQQGDDLYRDDPCRRRENSMHGQKSKQATNHPDVTNQGQRFEHITTAMTANEPRWPKDATRAAEL